MRVGYPVVRSSGLVVLVAGVSFAAASFAAAPVEEITVEAARAVPVGQTSTGVPVHEITRKARVSYADLDLTSAWGAFMLEQRIKEAAEKACKEIKVEYPVAGSTDENCTKEAFNGAMVSGQKVIDAKRAAVKK